MSHLLPPLSASRSASWTSLVASTAGDLGAFHRFRARLQVPEFSASDDEAWRIVVQVYSPDLVDDAGIPARTARPLGSVQRGVTPEEMRGGLEIDVVHLEDGRYAPEELQVIAWVEPGPADLELDGLRHRPGQAARLTPVRRGMRATRGVTLVRDAA